MNEKIIGYILLVCGIAIIVYSAINVTSVFTGNSQPIDLFKLSGISVDIKDMIGKDLTPEQRKQLAKSEIQTQQEILKAELVNSPLNYISHIVFMTFIAGVGFRIAKLGVMLVRPIKVSLKSQESIHPPTK